MEKMNETLELAQSILQLLSESNQSLEGKLAAIEIVRTLQRADPYGLLALPSLALMKSSEDSSQSRSTERSGPQSRLGEHSQPQHNAGIGSAVTPP
jgi:hypothetical protein